MIKSTKALQGMSIEATDGSIGSIHDVFFDDRDWHIHYFSVDTERWLPGRRVLIDARALHRPWRDCAGLPVDLTRKQVKIGPGINVSKPASPDAVELAQLMKSGHLHGSRELLKCGVQATDARAGKIGDILIDPEAGKIRYFVVELGRWIISRKQVLLLPECIERVDWASSSVITSRSQRGVKCCPDYHLSIP